MKRLQKVKEFTKEYKWQLLTAGIGLGIMAVGMYKLKETTELVKSGNLKLPEGTGFDNPDDASLIDELVINWEGEPYDWFAGEKDGNEWIFVTKDLNIKEILLRLGERD